MNNYSEEKIIEELFYNFLTHLNVIQSKLIINVLHEKNFIEDFDKNSFLNNIFEMWQKETKKLLQEKINSFSENQKENKNLFQQKILNSIYGGKKYPIDTEDIQELCNNSYKKACKKVSIMIKEIKGE